jgi:hypothetical protein
MKSTESSETTPEPSLLLIRPLGQVLQQRGASAAAEGLLDFGK